MQVPDNLILIAADIIIALLVCVVLLFIRARKLKLLVRRQQEKIIELLKLQQEITATPLSAAELTAPTQAYKDYINTELDTTAARFTTYAPDLDITLDLPEASSVQQRILALRYAFLRAEELGATETRDSDEYWTIFQQTLEPLLATKEIDQGLAEELDTAKKRIENLEKFKRLFFDMEGQWSKAQASAQSYYDQLQALSEGVENRTAFNNVLDNYHGVYDNIQQNITQILQNSDSLGQHKTINITRQDPRAAEEITKLRNVAADQYRIINDLQRKLVNANTTEEKETIIQELQQQLQRQIRFVQESETCVQLLEDELAKAHEEISLQEKSLDQTNTLNEENRLIKNTLHNFTLESKELISNINDLEEENVSLKLNMRQPSPAAVVPTTSNKESSVELKKIQSELIDMKKQYAELEEKYLDLKLGS